MKNKFITPILAIALVLSMALTGCGSNAAQSSPNPSTDAGGASAVQTAFAGGSGTAEDPWQIADADQLAAIQDHLDSHYILTANIDFGGATIKPIGAWVSLGTEGEDAETPKPEYAFTGTFNGGGHTISNYVINEPDTPMAVGLFACVTGEGATVTNLTVKNATVSSSGQLVGCVIGFQNVPVSDLTLSGSNTVTGGSMVGGLIGGSMADVTNCSAVANVTMVGENVQAAGILIGGEEGGSVENCTVTGGSVTAVDSGAFSVGAFVGCFQESAYAKNCSVANVTVTVGENASMVGGLSGHAGTPEGAPTTIENCTVSNITLTLGEGSERVGGISGSGFYGSAFTQYFPEPCAMAVKNCTVSGLTVTGGKLVGSVLGYAYNNSTVQNCTSTVTWNGNGLDTQIGGDSSVPLDQLS